MEIARLSFNGVIFELTGMAQGAAQNAGFHWDGERQLAWTGLRSIAEKFKQYADASASRRFQEESARRQRDVQESPIRHKELLDRFLEITDRKVSVSDDYGDDKWDALPKEVVRLLSKAAKVDHDEIEPIKRTVRFLQQRAP
jgi:hypothetical protein